MLILAVKAVHIIAAAFFFAGGLVIAWFKIRADSTGDLRVLAWYQREIVLADWIFTLPSSVVLPVSGAALVELYGLSWMTPWVRTGIGLYMIAGVMWMPAARLQMRMRALAAEALEAGSPLPEAFHRANRTWLLLGIPAFAAAVATFWAMVGKWGI